MIKATYADKDLVSDILTSAFDKNKSVNYLIRQNHNRLFRIREFMDYSFEQCMLFGEVYLTDDRKACALILQGARSTCDFGNIHCAKSSMV
ncbi:hypothetical protein [Pedobacter sp.]|uniref:hypothetical protein n=1 Tax=Pedobacter sp. TaxID=1411316 RepID=UPI003D7FEB4A